MLRDADAGDAVATLAGRAADAGMFNLFLKVWPGEACSGTCCPHRRSAVAAPMRNNDGVGSWAQIPDWVCGPRLLRPDSQWAQRRPMLRTTIVIADHPDELGHASHVGSPAVRSACCRPRLARQASPYAMTMIVLEHAPRPGRRHHH